MVSLPSVGWLGLIHVVQARLRERGKEGGRGGEREKGKREGGSGGGGGETKAS